MKRNRSLFLTFLILAVHLLPVTAFEWPQGGVTEKSFAAVFGQLRGHNFSSSLVFTEPAEIAAIESGTVIAVLGGSDSEMGWFHSPLGNAVIIAHEDGLLSVYGNLTQVEVNESTPQVAGGTKLGTSGGSGWQSGQSSLELQIIDTEQDSAINPRLLMPRLPQELPISLYGITAIGRNGETLELRTRKSLPAGTYKLYRGREQEFFPHVTSVAVNGAAVETITFDSLVRSGRRLAVAGRRPYNATETYPTPDKQFLAEITLTKGRNTLSVTVADINGKEYTANYTLEEW